MSLLRRITAGIGDLITDAFGVQKVEFPLSLFHSIFTFDIPPNSWLLFENSINVATSNVLTSVDGEAKIATTPTLTVNHIESRAAPKYQPSRGKLFSTAIRAPLKTKNSIREWGMSTVENGVTFRLKSNGLLHAVIRSNSIDTHEEIIDTSKVIGFDVEKSNGYDIQFHWRGSGIFKFFILDLNTGKPRLVHTINLIGTQTELSIQNPSMPAMFKSTRLTEDADLFVGCADLTSENGGQLTTNYTSAVSREVNVTTDDFPVLVVKVPNQIAGKTNTRSLVAVRVSVKATKKGSFRLCLTRDPADIIGATFVPVGNGSFTETDSEDTTPGAVRAASVLIANLEFVTEIAVEPNVRISVDSPSEETLKVAVVRGDFIVITAKLAGAAGVADTVLEWGEEN